MKYFSYIILILFLQLLISCEKNVDLETPGYSPKLVIHAFISPDDTVLKVHVSTNRNVFGKKFEYSASLPVNVTLFDEEKELKFSSMDSEGICYLKYKIMYGKEYKILVKCAGYPDASAVCNVPLLKNFSVDLDTVSEFINYNYSSNYQPSTEIPNGYFEQKAIIRFFDMPGEKNYYSLGMTFETHKYSGNFNYNLSPVVEENDHRYYGDYSTILSDNLIDGKQISQTYNYYYDYYYGSHDSNLYSLKLNAEVLETDYDYYKYHVSLMDYTGTGDPFTEFTPLYTNVTGGYGIFASYITYRKTLKLK